MAPPVSSTAFLLLAPDDFFFAFVSRSITIRMLRFDVGGTRRKSSLKPSLWTLSSRGSLVGECVPLTLNEPSAFEVSSTPTWSRFLVRLIVAPEIGLPSPSTITPLQTVYPSQPTTRITIRQGETRHIFRLLFQTAIEHHDATRTAASLNRYQLGCCPSASRSAFTVRRRVRRWRRWRRGRNQVTVFVELRLGLRRLGGRSGRWNDAIKYLVLDHSRGDLVGTVLIPIYKT